MNAVVVSLCSFMKMIKVEHSVFALPFAYMGTVLATEMPAQTTSFWAVLGWVTVAMVGARSAAMGLNRVIDAHIDRRNPRTAHRVIAAGKLSVRSALVWVFFSLVLLFVGAAQLNETCLLLLPIALFALTAYSYTKRFTSLCHLALGATIGLAPMGGWVAVTGSVDVLAWLLGSAVACWVAGFDIVYALADQQFDRTHGVHSIPARYGTVVALWVARGLHVLTFGLFIAIGVTASLSFLYALGVVIAGALLFYEHWLIRPHDQSRLQMAFFTLNGTLSVVLFAMTVLDRWLLS
jgi:4-hydroxybenzoate polyprenyltransferase